MGKIKRCDFTSCDQYWRPTYRSDLCCESCPHAATCLQCCEDVEGYCKTRRQTRRLVFTVFAIFVIAMLVLIGWMSLAHPLDAFAAAPQGQQIKKTVTVKATWYCGKSAHTRGADGRLKSGKSISINNAQRKALGIHYGDKVYIKAPKKYLISGYWTVKDTGCRRGIADLYYARRSAVPPKFRRAGVVKAKMLVLKGDSR